jgi:hypothetical protein
MMWKRSGKNRPAVAQGDTVLQPTNFSKTL